MYLDKEVCMNNGSQNMDTDDNNLVLNEEEVEGPSQYEFAKLVLCILIQERRNQKDYDYSQARRSISRTELRDVTRKLTSKMENESIVMTNRGADMAHAFLSKEEIVGLIQTPTPLLTCIRQKYLEMSQQQSD